MPLVNFKNMQMSPDTEPVEMSVYFDKAPREEEMKEVQNFIQNLLNNKAFSIKQEDGYLRCSCGAVSACVATVDSKSLKLPEGQQGLPFEKVANMLVDEYNLKFAPQVLESSKIVMATVRSRNAVEQSFTGPVTKSYTHQFSKEIEIPKVLELQPEKLYQVKIPGSDERLPVDTNLKADVNDVIDAAIYELAGFYDIAVKTERAERFLQFTPKDTKTSEADAVRLRLQIKDDVNTRQRTTSELLTEGVIATDSAQQPHLTLESLLRTAYENADIKSSKVPGVDKVLGLSGLKKTTSFFNPLKNLPGRVSQQPSGPEQALASKIEASGARAARAQTNGGGGTTGPLGRTLSFLLPKATTGAPSQHTGPKPEPLVPPTTPASTGAQHSNNPLFKP